MNWAQPNIFKGELVEIFHKENNTYLSFLDFQNFFAPTLYSLPHPL